MTSKVINATIASVDQDIEKLGENGDFDYESRNQLPLRVEAIYTQPSRKVLSRHRGQHDMGGFMRGRCQNLPSLASTSNSIYCFLSKGHLVIQAEPQRDESTDWNEPTSIFLVGLSS